MKAVLISIQPKWCELIASGKKTVEVRKTKPKLETPFKCYIYCTKDKNHSFCTDDGEQYTHIGNGKVIGEFLCSEVSEFESELWDDETYERITRVVHTEDWEGYPETESYYVAEDGEDNYLCRQSCLTWEELRSYVGQDFNTFFGWHISDLVIYDKPKELSEFRNADKCPYASQAGCTYKYHCFRTGKTNRCGSTLERPPQSWCYVEELEGR